MKITFIGATHEVTGSCYYLEAAGKIVKDTITLDGNDWLFTQHQVIDTIPTEDDFKKTVANYLSWKMSNLMRGYNDYE